MIITDEIRQKVRQLAEKHNLSLVVLFGSQATGRTHAKSDVDIGYASRREIDYQANYQISLELARLFKNPDVEVVNIDNLAPVFKKQVADTGILLFQDKEHLFGFYKIQAIRDYMDTKPLRLYRDARLKRFIQKYAQFH